jgi:serine/threonine protein kinase
MEFVDGPDLRAFLNSVKGTGFSEKGTGFSPYIESNRSDGVLTPEGTLPVEQALHLTRQIAEGLGAAHAKGMVHRDIKPENILMAREGGAWLPKIADFGIVATKESSDVFTRTGGTLLTMTYAAPEQWRGTPAAELDGRTDLYALGGVLHEMLTGQTPFQSESYEGWAHQHQNTPPPPPSTLRPELAHWQGLDALVQRLLAKGREDRPKDVAELLGLLEAVRYCLPEARRETVAEYSGKRADGKRSRTIIVWVSAVFAIALIVFVFVTWYASHRPEQPKKDNVNKFNPSEVAPSNSVSVVKPNNSMIDFDAIAMKYGGWSFKDSKVAEKDKKAEALYEQKQYSEAMPLFEQVCAAGKDSGNARACTFLGYINEKGLGVTQDYDLAAKQYVKACNVGWPQGCFDLGILYENGNGVTKSYTKAAALYRKACDNLDQDGCNNLGILLFNGKGMIRDYIHAAALFSKACDAGNDQGCTNLGINYLLGLGVDKDLQKARQLFDKGCAKGDQAGCYQLNKMNQ